MSNVKNIIRSLIVTILFGFLEFYLLLPPINLSSPLFWLNIFIICIVFTVCLIFSSFEITMKNQKFPKEVNKILRIAIILGVSLIGLILLINFVLSPLFNSKSYASRIEINENGNFIEDISQVNFDHLPLLDKSSSQKLGDRVMGQMPELVSQFLVSNLYTQINYNEDIIRVTPLEYNGFIKFLTNKKDGVKGYIIVNSVTGETKLVKLDKGMKYMPSAYFSKDLMRKLRFSYPTLIFDTPSFEIDNDGNPYWVIPTVKYSGIGLRKEINGVVVLDPITGKSVKYNVKDVPAWIDHVYSAELIIEQVDDWGLYKKGFFNSLFGQKEVVQTTDGYNYLIINDDVYLYTGITSTSTDESNIGFILTNMRTKETVFYPVPGAEEYSAMASAEGQVQQMKYTASFPLLINLNNKPTYLLSLKDNAGLVKMYAFVDVTDYQKVSVTDASEGIGMAAKKYLGKEILNVDSDKLLTNEITIKWVNMAMINGTSYYYLKDTNNKKYRVSIEVDEQVVPFIKTGDKLNIGYLREEDLIDIVKIIKE